VNNAALDYSSNVSIKEESRLMGHLAGKEALYRKLGKKIDGLTVRVPWNEKFHAILKELYTADEADLIVKMPYRMSSFTRIRKITQIEETKLQKLLEGMCAKGLMMDVNIRGKYFYTPSPFAIGVFEFTMMRTGGNLNTKEWARMFHDYMGDFLAANDPKGGKVSILRALPHEGTVAEGDFVEVLDYEKASRLAESANRFSLGLCSCRHEKYHLGEKKCETPLETCASFDFGADYLIRNKLAREISKTEMLEHLARSRESGLVLSADNVKKNISAICSCCGCCCNVLLGISKLGYNGILVTSNFIAHTDTASCIGCGKCAKACPIDAIQMSPVDDPGAKIKKKANVDGKICLGCGVCVLQCTKTESLKLVKREKRVLHPESTFERVILQCLEKGTLQNQLFDNPRSITHGVMRGIVGGFLQLPPVKKALMSDALRSTFLNALISGVHK
jgi:Na+-translocating ferredoxin:NAD+ oxidoreductase RNF subunit RnfB